MSIQLPDKLAWVLNLLGFMWPEADEDKLRACAQAWRDFGAELERIKLDARLVAADVTAENQGDSIDSFERYWQGIGGTGGDFDRAKEAADHMATVLGEPFGMAALVEGMKIAILAQLTLLAGEVGADQLFAVVTLGGSEAVAAGEVIVTRLILRRIIEDVIHRIEREIVEQLKGHVKELLRKILGTALRRAVKAAVVSGGMDLGKQEADFYIFHSRTHIDPGELAAATGTGFVFGAVVPGARRGRTRNVGGRPGAVRAETGPRTWGWPPTKPPLPKPAVHSAGAAEWRYRRYVNARYKKGAGASDVMKFDTWRKRYFQPVLDGGRPGRRGGSAQVSTREKLVHDGFQDVENVKLGERKYVDMVGKNDHGGTQYVEVDDMLQRGTPKAAMRAKIAKELAALRPNDTLLFVDKNDPTLRILYMPGDDVNTMTVDASLSRHGVGAQ